MFLNTNVGTGRNGIMVGTPKDVFSEFIQLTSKIENGKQNILDFGSEDMIFYRGEIHMIRAIGLNPGI